MIHNTNQQAPLFSYHLLDWDFRRTEHVYNGLVIILVIFAFNYIDLNFDVNMQSE